MAAPFQPGVFVAAPPVPIVNDPVNNNKPVLGSLATGEVAANAPTTTGTQSSVLASTSVGALPHGVKKV